MEGARFPSIGEAEYEVMTVLWREAPLTSSQIVGRIAPQREWRPATVKSMLARLLAKGVLTHQQVGRRYLYRPAVTRDEYGRQQCDVLIARIFDGDAGALVAHLISRGLVGSWVK